MFHMVLLFLLYNLGEDDSRLVVLQYFGVIESKMTFRKPITSSHSAHSRTVVHLTKTLDFLKFIQGLQADNHIIK